MSTERRTHRRARVIYGASASSGTQDSTRHCVVRNFSDAGALVEFKGSARQSSDDISLTIERKRSSYRARVVWWRENLAGLAFRDISAVSRTQDQDLEVLLRKSERKVRKLRQQVREALGQE